MGRGNTWTNNDGLIIGFERRDAKNEETGGIHTLGHRKEMELRLEVADVPNLAVAVARSSRHMGIPTGSVIRAANLVVISDVLGLTVTTGRLAVGTVDAAGVQVTVAGLIADQAEAALVAGSTVEGAGADIDGVALAQDTYPSIEITGANPTSGEVVLTIVYDEPVPSSESPAILVGEI